MDVEVDKRRLLVLGPFFLKRTTYRVLRHTIIPNKYAIHEFLNMHCKKFLLYNTCWPTPRAFHCSGVSTWNWSGTPILWSNFSLFIFFGENVSDTSCCYVPPTRELFLLLFRQCSDHRHETRCCVLRGLALKGEHFRFNHTVLFYQTKAET